jgi:G:T-mismatch repair DNA endonuclease (very short patch repair protein)
MPSHAVAVRKQQIDQPGWPSFLSRTRVSVVFFGHYYWHRRCTDSIATLSVSILPYFTPKLMVKIDI